MSDTSGRIDDRLLAELAEREVIAPAPTFRDALRRVLFERISTRIAAAVVLLFVFVAVFAPWLAPYDPLKQSFLQINSLPSWQHWIGTDDFGRDVLSRMIYGSQNSLIFGLLSPFFAALVGCTLGLTAGYFGGIVDRVVTRIIDMLMAFPELLLAILIAAAIGGSFWNIVLVLTVAFTPGFARVSRASTLSVKQEPYVEAAIAAGVRTPVIIFRHIVPNIAAPIVVLMTLWSASSIRIEATLSFLGIGTQPPNPSWGNIIREGLTNMFATSWPILSGGMAITVVVLAISVLGDRGARCPRSGDRIVSASLLDIQKLTIDFGSPAVPLRVVDDISFSVRPGEAVGIVGESGSGKSMTSLSILRLVPPPGQVTGRILFEGTDLMRLPISRMRSIRGKDIGMVFQEPMSSLNPVMTIGAQIAEALMLHGESDRARRRERVIELLRLVGMPDPEVRLNAYPSEFSGGMRQRVMVAMALSCNPKLLIADEPTTALDVTIQAQVLELMLDIRRRFNAAILLISHDLGIVAEICERVVVMYAGRIVEDADIRSIFADPKHPYTQGLLKSVPALSRDAQAALPDTGLGAAAGYDQGGVPLPPALSPAHGPLRRRDAAAGFAWLRTTWPHAGRPPRRPWHERTDRYRGARQDLPRERVETGPETAAGSRRRWRHVPDRQRRDACGGR